MSAAVAALLHHKKSATTTDTATSATSAPAVGEWDSDHIPLSPAGAAGWFTDCYTEITAVNLGSVFNNLLAVYIAIERGYNWEKGGGSSLGGTGIRPKQLTQWVGAGRGLRGGSMSKGAGPSIDSLAVFDDAWWRWWGKLQPSWRRPQGDKPGRFERNTYPASKGEWSAIRHPGQNGLLGVIATLYWWGKAVKKEGEREDRESWTEAVSDVKWLLKGLVASESKGADGGGE
ncbi:hypothetical protein C8F04DRAFT_948711 [Mycena alexandri]|uniref:Uncharacterized protein n=1 Tax=Mycena alexandri TaxID=1745969 RepID=A0AAD6T9F0_9AGAR|nr:hypothetical protein C8F04DRAFT_948711 [Mycena alexandri]